MHRSLKECTLPTALHAFITHIMSVGDSLWMTPRIRIFESNCKELCDTVCTTKKNTFLVNENILWKEMSLNLFSVSHFWTKAVMFWKDERIKKSIVFQKWRHTFTEHLSPAPLLVFSTCCYGNSYQVKSLDARVLHCASNNIKFLEIL